MTTPTREQVPLHPFTLSVGGWHEDERKAIQQAIEDARAAGRDQGLREAKEVCEARHANGNRKYTHADDCAAAIEQLRGK